MAGTELADPTVVVWSPQPGPQTALISCPVFDVLYGGARGGGKTDGMLGEWLRHASLYGEHATGIFFRRELTQLDEAMARAHQLFAPLGATWTEQRKTWVFPDGARLKFRYLDRDPHAEAYQGHSYTRVYFEELTNFPRQAVVDKLRATLRSAQGVPCGLRSTANPGGPGHQWVKARYIDPCPDGWRVLTDDHGLQRVFIPAKLSDNQILMRQDPMYVPRLKQSGSEQLVRAWLDGDWSVIEGAYFDCWRTADHVLRPFEMPEHWTRFMSMDWGSARPFSVGWWAVASETTDRPEGLVPRGALIRYREWYGAKAPNEGVKMTVEEVAAGIVGREAEPIKYRVVDPSMFAEHGGPSMAERMARLGVDCYPGDNKRVPGWEQMRARLVGEDGRPMLYVFSTCQDFIRTVPSLQHDGTKPEDIDTEAEDHAADEARYACMSRPYASPTPQPANRRIVANRPTFDELRNLVARRREHEYR